MTRLIRNVPCILALALAAVSMVGCATTAGTQVGSNGQPVTELVWPTINAAEPRQEGVFVNLLSLQNMNLDMTRYQVEHSIGLPQYGVWPQRQREWDYIFNFRTGAPSGEYVTCQYKVLFDTAGRTRSLNWKDPACAELVSKSDMKPLRKISLSSDAMFSFGASSVDGLQAEGRSQIIGLAKELSGARDLSITVIGHTDDIGSSDANLALSQARASAVRQLLIDQGINPAMIRAIGAGESQPIKSCPADLPREELIACLQPNRRVEIEILGVK